MIAEIIPQKIEDAHGLLRYRTSAGPHEGTGGKGSEGKNQARKFWYKMFSRSMEGTAKHSV